MQAPYSAVTIYIFILEIYELYPSSTSEIYVHYFQCLFSSELMCTVYAGSSLAPPHLIRDLFC